MKKDNCISSTSICIPFFPFLVHMVVLFLILWGNSILFLIVATPVYLPPNGAQVFSFLHNLYQPLIFLIFFMIAILTHVRWYCTAVLIYISLMVSDVEHLSLSLLGICPVKNYIYSDLLSIFKSDWLFCCWVVWFLFIFWILTLYKIYDLQNLSHSVGCLFVLLMNSFAVQKFLVYLTWLVWIS